MIMPQGYEHLVHSIARMDKEMQFQRRVADNKIKHLKHDSELEFKQMLEKENAKYVEENY